MRHQLQKQYVRCMFLLGDGLLFNAVCQVQCCISVYECGHRRLHVCVLQQNVLNMGDEAGDSNDQVTEPPLPPPYAGLPGSHTYDDVNISEEVSKTGIWHHLNSQPTLGASAAPSDVSQPRQRFALSFSLADLSFSIHCCIYSFQPDERVIA